MPRIFFLPGLSRARARAAKLLRSRIFHLTLAGPGPGLPASSYSTSLPGTYVGNLQASRSVISGCACALTAVVPLPGPGSRTETPHSYSFSQRSECARPRRPTFNYCISDYCILCTSLCSAFAGPLSPCSTPSLGPRLQPKPRGVRTGSCTQHGSNPTRQSDLPGPLTLLR